MQKVVERRVEAAQSYGQGKACVVAASSG